MAYSDFTLPGVIEKFGLRADTTRDLFGHVPPVPPSPHVQALLTEARPLASLMATEKGRAELLVAPLFVNVWQTAGHRVSVYSGADLDVDEADGLTGTCDFLLARGPQLPFVTAPVLVVVEAKRDDFTAGYGQCVAGMVAALRLNARENTGVETVYGAATNGFTWKFFSLRGTDLALDVVDYSVQSADRILGILLHLVGVTAPAAAA